MLEEPALDPERLALDRRIAELLRERLTLDAPDRPDAEALALREVAEGTDRGTQAILRAVWSRLDAPGRPAMVVHGVEAALMAVDRFGLNIRMASEPEDALAAVAGRTRAVIELGARPWWARLLARPELRVVAAYPDDARGRPRAFMISAETSGPTGDDRSFWVSDAAGPDARIVEALSAAGLAAEPLAAAGGLKLFMLAGYVQADDGRLTSAPGRLSGVIGAAPVF